MISKLDSYFAPNEVALKLRGLRQEVVASNIANADTPGYKARDFDFRAALHGVLTGTSPNRPDPNAQRPRLKLEIARTHPLHVGGPKPPVERKDIDLLFRNDIMPSIDGNTVDMNTEMANFADNAVRFQASLTFMQQRISGMRTALQSN